MICAKTSYSQDYQNIEDAFRDMAKNDTIYKVQFFSSKDMIHHFEDIENKYGTNELITFYKHQGLFRYTLGNYHNDATPAIKLKKELIQLGYTDAFIVAFKNGERLFGLTIYKKYEF